MDLHRPTPVIERVAETIAAASLSGAAAFGIFHAMPLGGAALTAATAAGAIAALAALGLLRQIDRASGEAGLMFEPGEFLGDDDVQLADKRQDELLLDDPIVPAETESRVTRLFERDQPEPLPDPGELVTRIADYLGGGRGSPQFSSEPARVDASDALHAALADIRRSLR